MPVSVFSVVQRINSTRDNGKMVGVIRVDANYNGIKTVCDRAGTGEGSALYILDQAGNEIYHADRTGANGMLDQVRVTLTQHGSDTPFLFTFGATEYRVSIQALRVTDWRIVDVRSMQTLTAAATQARNKAYLLAILCAALGMLVTVPLVKSFLRPIFQITGLMSVAGLMWGAYRLIMMDKPLTPPVEKWLGNLKKYTPSAMRIDPSVSNAYSAPWERGLAAALGRGFPSCNWLFAMDSSFAYHLIGFSLHAD